MYCALYRKWRPQKFEDVVGQKAVVTALKNQVATGRIGHAYLFTGVRGTGKTTCAKIFAKAVNCLAPHDGDPCDTCDICRGIDNGSILDVVEMDAASNNGVDDVRDLRDETAYTPSVCRYKVYIIDEVHMLSTSAFNALLKTLEEPPSHVIFILATTEIQKVPATILSRCQRYDFTRICPEDIAMRVVQIAEAEQLTLTPGAAALVARLADGALRDALSILDTCAAVSDQIDENVVRRMAGVTDKSYLFRLSDAISAGDGGAALAELAELRQQSVDVKRLAEELVGHYRNLMLASLPGGKSLLAGISQEEEQLYLEKAPSVGQAQAIRAIRTLGSAMEKMARGNNHRIELELAVFALTEGPMAAPAATRPQQTAPAEAGNRSFATAAPTTPQPFAAAMKPAMQSTAVSAAAADAQQTEKASEQPPWETQPKKAEAPAGEPQEPKAQKDEPALTPGSAAQQPALQVQTPPKGADEPVSAEEAPPWEAQPAAPAPVPKPVESCIADTSASKTPQPESEKEKAFDGWEKVIQALETRDPMLFAALRRSKAYYDGHRVLIDGGKMFRDFIRVNRDSQRLLKKVIAEVTGVSCGIGPYEPQAEAEAVHANAEQSLELLEKQGLDVVMHDSERGRQGSKPKS